MNELENLKRKVNNFAAERDWDQFHSPKNLAMALNVEAGELLEIFQWMKEKESQNLDIVTKHEAAEEIADIFVYLIRLSEKLGIDLVEETNNKIAKNAKKYPVEKARGVSTKYNKL